MKLRLILDFIFKDEAVRFLTKYKTYYFIRVLVILLLSIIIFCFSKGDAKAVFLSLSASVYIEVFAIDTWCTRNHNRPAKPFCDAMRFEKDSYESKFVYLANYLLFITLLIFALNQ
jgi:hypothetical protein